MLFLIDMGQAQSQQYLATWDTQAQQINMDETFEPSIAAGSGLPLLVRSNRTRSGGLAFAKPSASNDAMGWSKLTNVCLNRLQNTT